MLLITGSDGQLGLMFKHLYDNTQAYFANRTVLDITDIDCINQYTKNKNITGIINCASYNMVDKAEEDKELCFNTNTIGVKNLSQLSAILDVPLIHISTDYVFDGIRNTPYKETDTPIPINYYGETKLQGEKMFLEHAKTGVLIRTSWLYSEFNNNFLKTILNLSKIKKELQVIYDQIGTPTYTRDLTLIIKEIIPKIKKNKKEIYHFSNEGTASWYDFAHEIVTLCKYDCIVQPIKTENYSSKARRPKFSVLDKEKIKNELNIEIRHWKEALKECIKNLY